MLKHIVETDKDGLLTVKVKSSDINPDWPDSKHEFHAFQECKSGKWQYFHATAGQYIYAEQLTNYASMDGKHYWQTFTTSPQTRARHKLVLDLLDCCESAIDNR